MNVFDRFSTNELVGLFILFMLFGVPILTGCAVILVKVIRGDSDVGGDEQ